jgi:hypothetical protein
MPLPRMHHRAGLQWLIWSALASWGGAVWSVAALPVAVTSKSVCIGWLLEWLRLTTARLPCAGLAAAEMPDVREGDTAKPNGDGTRDDIDGHEQHQAMGKEGAGLPEAMAQEVGTQLRTVPGAAHTQPFNATGKIPALAPMMPLPRMHHPGGLQWLIWSALACVRCLLWHTSVGWSQASDMEELHDVAREAVMLRDAATAGLT